MRLIFFFKNPPIKGEKLTKLNKPFQYSLKRTIAELQAVRFKHIHYTMSYKSKYQFSHNIIVGYTNVGVSTVSFHTSVFKILFQTT